MTVIVAVKCTDGVVVGADGAATMAAGHLQTAKQPVKKLSILKENVIVGISGSVGLAQRLSGAIEDMWAKEDPRKKKSVELMTAMRTKLWEHIKVEMDAATHARQVVGQAAVGSALSYTVVALPVLDKPTLFQFDQQGAPEEATDALPCVAVGIGQQIADPFLAFLRRTLWPNNQPLTVADGIFATLWTLVHCIETAPSNIAEPKQLIVLDKRDGRWKARELTDVELGEQLQAIGEAEKTLRGFRESLRPAAAGDIQVPEPPKE